VTKYKPLFFLGAALVAFMLLVQHAHYTIDVAAAPFFSFAAYKITEKARAVYFAKRR